MTQLLTPIVCKWDGRVMQPGPSSLQRARKLFTEGGVYNLVEHEEPSDQERKRYFALVETAHQHMPEGLDRMWPTKDHLRYWALTFTPYRTTTPWSHSTEQQMGETIAMLVRCSQHLVRGQRWFRMERADAPQAYTVLQHFPLTQRVGLMSATDFRESANRSLDVICRAVNIPLDKLEQMSRHTT